MNFAEKLSQRITMEDVNNILSFTYKNNKYKQELYDIGIQRDECIGYHAAWILTQFSKEDNKWLHKKQDELIDTLLICRHGGRRRLILNLLYKQPLKEPMRIDYLDFCLDRIMSSEELPGVKSLCIKIAYEMCRPIPELQQELKMMLEMMQGELPPAILCVRRNVFKAMERNKSLLKL